MNRDLLSYLSGVIMEVSFQNGLLCVVVILKDLAPVLIFWKDMNFLHFSCFLSKYNLPMN